RDACLGTSETSRRDPAKSAYEVKAVVPRTSQGVAPSFGVELSPLVVRDAGEIEPAVTAFARGSNGGLIITTGTLAQTLGVAILLRAVVCASNSTGIAAQLRHEQETF